MTATPGAGKTTFGLALAERLRAARVIDRIIVVAPTDRLVSQVAARTGRKHADVHVDVRKEVPGPRTASASVEVLLARRDYLLAQVR